MAVLALCMFGMSGTCENNDIDVDVDVDSKVTFDCKKT